ncbi:MAG: ribosome biogenesis factor YjgA [Gammaproteobacteria bacterium]
MDTILKSKSQIKRDMLALQTLGERLVALNSTQLAKIPLDDTIIAAIHEAHRMRSHGAVRRQLQYIGRLMRSVDPKPIQAALDKIYR